MALMRWLHDAREDLWFGCRRLTRDLDATTAVILVLACGIGLSVAMFAVADTVLQHVHVTTCGYTTDPPLLCALMVFGADRMLFSVDHPFSDNSQAAAFLRDAPLSPADKQKIAHSNSEHLLRL